MPHLSFMTAWPRRCGRAVRGGPGRAGLALVLWSVALPCLGGQGDAPLDAALRDYARALASIGDCEALLTGQPAAPAVDLAMAGLAALGIGPEERARYEEMFLRDYDRAIRQSGAAPEAQRRGFCRQILPQSRSAAATFQRRYLETLGIE